MTRTRAFFVLVLPALVAHVLLPISLIADVWRAGGADSLRWRSALFLAGSYLAYLYIAGAWSWFGSLLRRGFPVLLALTACAAATRGRGDPSLTLDEILAVALSTLLGMLFFVMAVFAFRGRRAPAEPLEMVWPLRGGTFHVAQGGGSQVVNHHAAHPCQRHALDLLKLNASGVRATGLYPRQPERYAIWAATVVSPCDGVVAASVDGHPDYAPPDRDPVHAAGNYIAIESQAATVYLAHLMRGSLCVRPGDRVRAGQVVARAGNSGNTTEPHLHVHAEQGPYPGQFSGNPGLPIRFGGRYLVRNDRVVAPDHSPEAR